MNVFDGIYSLTPSAVADIGAMDDFYDLYIKIEEIYSDEVEKIKRGNESNGSYNPSKVNDSLQCSKEVRDAFEPVLQKYLILFSDENRKIHANPHAFKKINFLHYIKYEKVTFITFKEFLKEFEDVVCRILYKWRLQEKPKYLFEAICRETEHHLRESLKKYKKVSIDETGECLPTDAPLFIFRNLSRTACHIYRHRIVPETFTADFAAMSGKILLPVHYCENCKHYFIGAETLKLYEKNYGKLLVQKRKMDVCDSFLNLRLESILHEFGYNVSDGKTEKERQQLLIRLLETGKVTYDDITRCIEFNIQMHWDKPVALEKWKHDLKYVGDYIITHHK